MVTSKCRCSIAVAICSSFTSFYDQGISKDPVADFQSDGSGIVPAATILPKVPVSNLLLCYVDKY